MPTAIGVAKPAPAKVAAKPASDPRWNHSHYIVTERRLTFGRQYRITDPQGNLVAYCKQKMFKLKEDIRFYGDEGQQVQLFAMSAQKVFDFKANIVITDSQTGAVLGMVRRKGWKSLVKDEWLLFNPSGIQTGTLHEEGAILSFLRRWGDIAATFIPAKYTLFLGPEGSQKKAGHVKERFQLWGDTYDVHREAGAPIDARVLVGLVVLTDALGVGGKAS